MKLDDLHRDFEEHIELETRDNIKRGMSPEEARAAARRKFGNVGLAAEDTYYVWHRAWLDRLLQDARYALRMLRKQPAFAAVAILTLALGVGLNTAVFSVVNAVLLRPLPYPDADRLAWVTTYNQRLKSEIVAGPDFFDWKQQARSFEALVNYGPGNMSLAVDGEADQIRFATVGDGFFAVTGARPESGRLPEANEHDVIVLTRRLFERRFGARPDALGKVVTLNGSPYTVIGVLPAAYRFALPLDGSRPEGRAIEAYVPSTMSPENQTRGRAMVIVNVFGKLRPGVSMAQARGEIETIQAKIAAADHSGFYRFLQVRVEAMQDKVVGGARRGLLVLLAAVAFVLLIACGSVANLLLARAGARQREIAIRAAIGAGRGRMIGQLLVEGAMLSIAGAAIGFLVVRAAFAAMVRFGAQAVPRLADASIDGRVLAFTAALSMATTVIFALGPAISLSRTNLAGVLKDGGRTASAGLAGLRLRRLLMAGELALSVVLLTGAGLMLRSFQVMNDHPAGFQPDRLLTMNLDLSGPSYRTQASRIEFMTRVLEALRGVPGLRMSGVGNGSGFGFVRAEGVQFPPMQQPRSAIDAVSAGYLRALGATLSRGRWLTDDEPEPVVMVNEAFVRAVYGGANPIGRRIELPLAEGRPGEYAKATIAGVVADLKYSKLDEEPAPETYVPYRRAPFLGGLRVLALVEGQPSAVAGQLRRAVAAVDTTQSVYGVRTLEQALAESIAPRRFNLLLLAVFAVAALALAVVGVYGVMSYAVTQRSQEIGVRMALGAQRASVVRMIVQQGAAVAAAGVVSGLAAAAALTRLMKTLLYGVQPTDPTTFAAVCVVLLAAALLACFVPALRAARVDPVVALRYE
jgi:predicted permease